MSERPWQLEVFDKTLKKRQKYQELQGRLPNLAAKDCLLITCGDNNGAMNFHFRANGGRWQWADVEGDANADIEQLLGEPVVHLDPAAFPYDDQSFDCIVVVDVIEHLEDDAPFFQEVQRVSKPGGILLVTVPIDDERKIANRLKERAGMGLSFYGHTRMGYSIPELNTAVSRSGFAPDMSGTFIRPVTELLELGINFGYVFTLNRKKGSSKPERQDASPGHPVAISPTTGSAFNSHSGAFRLYSLAFPVLKAITFLDKLIPFVDGHAVVVRARREAVPDRELAESRVNEVEMAR